MMQSSLSTTFLDATLSSYRTNKLWADKAIAQVSDENLHVALDANTNSIAVIMQGFRLVPIAQFGE